MSIVYSKMIRLGSEAPAFTLPDAISEQELSLDSLKSEIATVIMFISNHCPFVQHLNEKLSEAARDYKERGISFIAIGSNDTHHYPQDGPSTMKKVAEHFGYTFPYLFDETQEVAHAYNAECTPDFFVFDGDLKLRYRGRFDETRPGMGQPTGNDMTTALDALIAGEPVDETQLPSIGCSIKWK